MGEGGVGQPGGWGAVGGEEGGCGSGGVGWGGGGGVKRRALWGLSSMQRGCHTYIRSLRTRSHIIGRKITHIYLLLLFTHIIGSKIT